MKWCLESSGFNDSGAFNWVHFREPAKKPLGKPDAGNPHVRFDERGWETGDRQKVSHRAVLDSTTLSAAARDKAASTSFRSVTVLDILFKYASAP
jgi:hypothetical protein